jgi:hypothetical protein
MPATVPAEISKALAVHSMPAGLTPDEENAYKQLDYFYTYGLGYANEMGLRPQTLYGLADSPTGLAAWILDHDIRSYELIARVFDGKKRGFPVMISLTTLHCTGLRISRSHLRVFTGKRRKIQKGRLF